MVGGVSSSLQSLTNTLLSGMFRSADADGDGKVSRSEFVANAVGGVSDTQAGALFDSLDTAGSGTLSQADFTTAFENLASQIQALLIQTQENGLSASPPPPDPRALFDEIDSDGDGVVSREEFIAGRPDDMSEEEASALFDDIAGEDADEMTEKQFVAGMPGGGGADPAWLFSALDTDGDGSVSREEFIAGRPDDVSEEEASALFDDIAGEDADSVSRERFVAGMTNESSSASSGNTELENLIKQIAAIDPSASAATTSQIILQLLSASGSYQQASLLGNGSTTGLASLLAVA